ncbi:MAG TPA: hypothetical protein VM939_06470 [Gemmatimonadaceae bacterium]|nr:hypothetical protein [Gemmatimonadaceae bacterium]
MRKAWSLGAALMATTILAGCSAVDLVGTGRVAGTYELRSVNGYQVPAVYYEEPGYRLEVLNANFTLENDGTFTEALILRETVRGSTNTSSTSTYGNYDYYNGEFTFDEAGGHRYYGRINGSTLIIEDEGVTMEYRRL